MENSSKQFLYHKVPDDMEGNILYPLNILKEEKPHIYKKAIEKYNGREDVMKKTVPTLQDCSWNDVLHLAAVHPSELKKALLESGMKIEELENMRFYQIDPEALSPESTTVYTKKQISTERGKEYPEEFIDYDAKALDDHSNIPSFTQEYYKEMINEGKRPLRFLGVPHILHKGSIDISNFPIITV